MKTFKEITETWGNSTAKGSDFTSYKDLEKHYPEPKKENGASIGHYRGLGSNRINHLLWSKHKGIDPEIPEYQHKVEEHINNIDDEIHSHRTPRKMVVWSGTRNDPRIIKDENNIVHHPAFLSTSLHRYIGEDFAVSNQSTKPINQSDETNNHHVEVNSHLLKIIVPKNHPGYLHKYNDSHLSEQEFMLPHGTNLRYKGTSSEIDSKTYKYRKKILFTHHMEVVPHEDV